MANKLGRNVRIRFDVNGVGGGSASWQEIPGQKDATLEPNHERVDGTTKGTDGWKEEVPVGQGWVLSLEGNCDPALSIYQTLFNASYNQTKVWVQVYRQNIGGTNYECQAYVEVSEKSPVKDLATYSMKFTLQGQPVASA